MTAYGTGDGQVHPGMPDDLERPESEQGDPNAKRYGDQPKDADLLTMGETEAAAELLRRWTVQDQLYQRSQIEWEVNRRRLEGDCNIWAAKRQDVNQWQVYIPPGSHQVPVALFNKSYRLCERFGSVVFADWPQLEAEAPPNDAKGSARARFATRVLEDVDSEGKLNDRAAARKAFGEVGPVTGSGYVHYFADPHAGGRQPLTVKASPNAQTVDDATRDPATGLPWPDELVTRYVAEDGTLVDDPSGAALQWVPALTRDVLSAEHVRFEPHTALDAWDAEGVYVAGYYPWAQVAGWFPSLAEEPAESIDHLTKVRPPKTRSLMPWRDGRFQDSPGSAKPRERLTFVMWAYYLECADYPDGFRGVVVGDRCVEREPWVESEEARAPLDLPVVQFKQFPAADGSPHGWGLMHLLGPASEWRAELVGAVEDVLDRIRSRKVFVPTNSGLQGKSALLQAMTYIPILAGAAPSYEEVPTDALVPALKLFEVSSNEMNDASFLQEGAQGMESANVNSGKQAQVIQSAVAAGLSTVRANCEQAFVRAGRVKLQQLRRIATVPQMVKYSDGDEDTVAEWSGADLRGITSVKLKAGSFSGLTELQKAERAMMFGQAGLMPPDDLQEAVQSAIGVTFGWKENPHARRVRSQVKRWEKAVEGLDDAARMAPPQEAPDQMSGQMMPLPDPEAVKLLEVRPVDSEPAVAKMRARILGEAMSGGTYEQAPPGWRAALDMAYQHAYAASAAMMMGAPGAPQDGGQGGPAMAPQEPGESPDAEMGLAA